MKKLICSILFSIACLFLNAQSFRYSTNAGPISLPELQKQLRDYADSADLSKAKHWKYIKRWEDELSRHADGKGNPGNARGMHKYLTRRSLAEKSAQTFDANWLPVGPDYIPENYTGYLENGIGRINCIAFHPTLEQVYYVGVAQGGLWKTTNGGASWIPLTDQLPITRISDIAINPNNPEEIYISLCDFEYVGVGLALDNRKRYPHYGLGVYKSMDGGLSWNPTGLGFELNDFDASLIRKILIHPENDNEVVACGVSGMFRSTDAGTTWNQVNDAFHWDMIQQPGNPNVLFASGGWLYNANYGYAAIYKSIDFGISWTELPTGIPATGEVQRIKLSISPSNPNIIQAIAVDTLSGLYGFYRSEDNGMTWDFSYPGVNILEWSEGLGSGGQGTYDLVLHIDNTNPQKVYAGGVNLWMSEDGGQTFNPASHWTLSYGPTIHADMHYLTQNPLTQEFFICNDGGVYKTSEIQSQTWESAQNGNFWPSTWENIGNGMQITSFYRLSSDKQSYPALIAGAQDNASSYFDGFSWYTVFGGDGMDNYMSTFNPGTVLGSSQFGYFYWTSDGGLSNLQTVQANINNELADWTVPIEGCMVEPYSVYAGFENIVRSFDEGFSWETTGYIDGNYTPINALSVAPSNCDIVYACKRLNYLENIPSAVFRSDDGGQSWNEQTANLPDSLFFSSVAVSLLNSSNVALSIAAFSEGQKVYTSTNGGLSWTNSSFNLPDVPVNMLKYLPASNDLLAATDAGVFVLRSGQTTWIDESLGLPNVIVSDIEINEAANKIYVSTFGRGIWAADLNLLLSQSASNICKPSVLIKALNTSSFEIDWSSNDCNNSFQNIAVYDVKGRRVVSETLNGSNYNLNLTGKGSGIYFGRLSGSDNASYTFKLLKADN